MYFVTFDENNKINGFFNDAINSLIPESAIPISDEKWQELSANPQNYVLQDGEIILLESQPQAQPIPRMNWAEFNRTMFQDTAYNQFINDAVDKESVRRLEILAISLGVNNNQNPNVDDVKLLWNAVLESIPLENRPNISVIDSWNLITNSSFMSFRFAEDGFMVQLPE